MELLEGPYRKISFIGPDLDSVCSDHQDEGQMLITDISFTLKFQTIYHYFLAKIVAEAQKYFWEDFHEGVPPGVVLHYINDLNNKLGILERKSIYELNSLKSAWRNHVRKGGKIIILSYKNDREYKLTGNEERIFLKNLFPMPLLGKRKEGLFKINVKDSSSLDVEPSILKKFPSYKAQISKPTDHNFKSFLGEYLGQVESEHHHLKVPPGFLVPPIELEESFIHLRATEDVPISEASYVTDRKEWLTGVPQTFVDEKSLIKKSSISVLPIDRIIENAASSMELSKRHMVFLGPAGSGKTTLLKYLAFSTSSGKEKAFGLKESIPIFVNLPDYARNGSGDLIQHACAKAVEDIASERDRNGIKKALQHAISECKETSNSNGGVVFLLDALDETGEHRESICREIEHIGKLYRNAYIIVTSRVVGYYQAPLSAFMHYLVDDLHTDEIYRLVGNLLRIMAEKTCDRKPEKILFDWAQDKAELLIKHIEKSPALVRISSNPLNLVILVAISSDPDQDLPGTQAELYKRYIEKHLLDWETNRLGRLGESLPVSRRLLVDGFREICWVLHRAIFGDMHYDPTRNLIEKEISQLFMEDSAAIVDFWIRAGLLFIVKRSIGSELILPQHLTFLEYGFSRKLAELWNDEAKRKDIWEDLSANLHNKHLHEPLMLFISQVDNPASFLNRVNEKEDDCFASNLVFCGHAACAVKDRLKDDKIIQDLADKFRTIFRYSSSKEDFLDTRGRHYLRCYGLLAGVDSLVELFRVETEEWSRGAIAEIVAEIGGKSSVTSLKYLFDFEMDFLVKLNIAEDIYKLGNTQLASACLKELYEETSDESDRMEIIYCVAGMGKTMIPFLKALSRKERLPWLRGLISMHIGSLGEKKLAMSCLKQLYREEGGETGRICIIRSMCKLEECTAHMLKRLSERESSTKVKANIALEIGKLGEKELAISQLRQLYEVEKIEKNRRDIEIYLARLGETERLISNEEHFFETTTDEGLKGIIALYMARDAGKDSIPTLRKLFIKEPTIVIRAQLAYVIGTLEDNKEPAIQHLLRFFRAEENATDRKYIADLISWLGYEEIALSCYCEIFSEERNDLDLRWSIIGSVSKLQFRKQAISLLDEFLGKRINASFFRKFYYSLYTFAEKEGLLIFHNGKGQFRLCEIPERYTFSPESSVMAR